MKVLIHKYLEDLKPVGGSNGYCFNILSELKKRNISNIEFLKNKPTDKFQPNTLKKYFSTFISLFKKNSSGVDYNKYDVIHFHSSKDFYKQRRALKKFKGKIIFTTHSPVPYHLEMIENIKKHQKFLGFFLLKHSFSRIDSYCFNHADYILLPCKEAEESYYLHWPKYIKIHKKNEIKYRYIATGIVGANEGVDATEYRTKLGYKEDDFIVSYVGRHNEVKGYDRIIKICELLKNENIKFLIGGLEKPLSGPRASNWKEIGWTNDPYSLINASNVFILPNRETYFDIVLLEVLSLGKPCILSETGGNKVILKKKCKNVYGFKTEEEAVRIINDLYSRHISYKKEPNIIEFFEKNYTISLFVDKYLDLLKEIEKD